MKKIKIIILLIILFLSQSCNYNQINKDTVYLGDTNSTTAIILNQDAQTLSTYNFEAQEFKADAITISGSLSRGLFHYKKSPYAFITSSGNNHLEIFEIKDNHLTKKKIIPMPSNCSPYDANNFNNNEFVYVSCIKSNLFLKINMNTEKVVKQVKNLNKPQSFTIYNNQIYLLSTNYNNGIYRNSFMTIFDLDLNIIKKVIFNSLKNPNDIKIFPSLNEIHILFTGDYSNSPSKIKILNLSTVTSKKNLNINKKGYNNMFFNDQYVYLWGYNQDTIKYHYKTLKIIDPVIKRLDLDPNGNTSQIGFNIYKNTMILSFSSFLGDDLLFIGDKSNIKNYHKELKASSGVSDITIINQ